MQAAIELRLGAPEGVAPPAVPGWAAQLRARGAGTVCVLDVPQADGTRLHWLESAHARGWLQPAREATLEGGRGTRFLACFDEATRQGFVGADAAILATLAVDTPAGAEPLLPCLSWDEAPLFALAAPRAASTGPAPGLYALVESAQRLGQVLAAGVRTVQLRLKTPAAPDAAWPARLREEVAGCVALARDAGAMLYVNDHWQLAAELGAPGVHLGQEDLLALGDAGRADLLARGMDLGVSSHSVWELCRARALAPRYIACGPVWATTTKDMPWVPQGLDNLAWWCRMAQAPVVAIGGILGPAQVRDVAASGCDSVCIVRGLGPEPAAVLPALWAAFEAGRREPAPPETAWPHPTLPAVAGDASHG